MQIVRLAWKAARTGVRVFLALAIIAGAPLGASAQTDKGTEKELRNELEKARLEIHRLREENARLKGQAPSPEAAGSAAEGTRVPAPPPSASPTPPGIPAGSIVLPAPVADGTTVTVEDVLAAYRTSARAGDARFKGRRIRVTGEVEGFKKAFVGLSWTVQLSGADALGLVRCHAHFPGISDFRPGSNSRILEGRRPFREWQVLLQQGERATFEGMCEGIDDAVIVLKDCQPANANQAAIPKPGE